MDKNLFLAIALSILVYAGWFAWLEKHAPPKPAAAASAVPASPVVGAPAPAASAASNEEPSAETPRVALVTPQADIEFSAAGAAIASYKYRGPLAKVQLVLAPQPGLFATWPKTMFKLVSKGENEAVFEGRDPSGAVLTKTFQFDPAGGLGTLKLSLSNRGASPIQIDGLDIRLGPGLGTVEGNMKDLSSQWRTVEYVASERAVAKIKPSKPTKPGWTWAGVDNRYFGAFLFSPSDAFPSFTVDPVDVGGKTAPLDVFSTGAIKLAPKASRVVEARFYVGPKDYQKLKGLGEHLQEAVDFGFFGAVGLVVYKTLRELHRLTGNYGWSIIILTILIQGLTFPLTFKSLKAAASMRKLQPKIQAIQTRFKDDPKRMNVEMMQLYKQSGTNPLGGCLPMVLQLPIFWALFAALRNSWELHGAPFMFWIRDLSAHDPFYVLPIVMGGIMFVQQKASPAAPDPQQAQMMQFMPIIFTFMFLNFPAGLVLYWMTNSAMSLALQTALKTRLETA